MLQSDLHFYFLLFIIYLPIHFFTLVGVLNSANLFFCTYWNDYMAFHYHSFNMVYYIT